MNELYELYAEVELIFGDNLVNNKECFLSIYDSDRDDALLLSDINGEVTYKKPILTKSLNFTIPTTRQGVPIFIITNIGNNQWTYLAATLYPFVEYKFHILSEITG